MAEETKKTRFYFGYLPLFSECVPLHPGHSQKVDWGELIGNVGAGLLIGMRETLGMIVSANLVFSGSDYQEIKDMLPIGICMMWYSTIVTIVWYAIFGRLQYAYGTAQDIIGILQAAMLASAAQQLHEMGQPEQIPATALAIISLSAILSGLCSFLVGTMGLGRYLQLFPAPVVKAFLGSIGFFILRTSLQTSSGVKFQYFYPVSFSAFCQLKSLQQVGCQVLMVCCIQYGPELIEWYVASNKVRKLRKLLCLLLPLAIFYAVVAATGVSMEELAASGWTYPEQAGGGAISLWTTYSLSDADINVVAAAVPSMGSVVILSVLCTMTGVLGILERFPKGGPAGDPDPYEIIDYDRELTTVGVSNMLLGLTRGTVGFQTFTAIQLRNDGGTHRVGVLAVALFIGGALISGISVGHYIPKWFLSGLFMNTALDLLHKTLLESRSLPRTQYAIILSCFTVAIFTSPFMAIKVGLLLSVLLFLADSSERSIVANVVSGDQVVSRTMRPVWELRTLRQQGDRILLVYLQGHLFFGSVDRLTAALAAAMAGDRVEYCILSFARVQVIDPSAARRLKIAFETARARDLRVIYCRMNPEVRATMISAQVVKAEIASTKRLNLWRALPRRGTWPLPTSPGDKSSPRCNSFAESGDPLLLGIERRQSDPLLPIEDTRVDSSTPQTWHPSNPRVPTLARHDVINDEAGHYFKQETDALDYCGDLIADRYCYTGTSLEPYMMAYYKARAQGERMAEKHFEDMNAMKRGTMNELKKYCQVLTQLKAGEKIPDMKSEATCTFTPGLSITCDHKGFVEEASLDGPALGQRISIGDQIVKIGTDRYSKAALDEAKKSGVDYEVTFLKVRSACPLLFVLRGGVAVVETKPQVTGARAHEVNLFEEQKGFTFHPGKRLHKRYPAGYIVGKANFFLKLKEQFVDPQHIADMIVSTRLSSAVEIWALRCEEWKDLPDHLRNCLLEVLCSQHSLDIQHARIEER